MTITAQQYAALAENSYDTTRKSGIRDPEEREKVNADGVVFEVLEHVDNRTNGYAGTVYQRVDTGDIVVAHRGTNEIARDAIIADAGMVVTRSNWQANDALALTKRALGYAKESAAFFSGSPEVTVTGHSLGGTLAQISAHHYDLKGHTYNAYGAVSLNRKIPEGGNKVINHVMATDPVGAASAHYGQVRVYAIPEEIQELYRNGYVNNSGGMVDWMSRRASGAMPNSLKSHEMNNFLDVGRDGKPDVSVLNDPKAYQLAQDNAVMIDKYRSDVRNTRGGISLSSDIISSQVPVLNLVQKILEFKNNNKPEHDKQPSPDKNEPPTNDKHSSLVPDIDKDPHAFLDKMLAAGQSGDNAKFRAFTQVLAQSDVAQEFRKNTMAEVDRLEQERMAETQVAERAQQEQQQEQEQARQQSGPSMRA